MVPSSPLVNTADPIQADLYFESADGYGKWRILCSGPCLRDLARDGAQSNPVLRRLEYVFVRFPESVDTKMDVYFSRELSLGCFSETNQKRLTKDSPIEIYRARLPGSARLVVSHPLGVFVIEGLDVVTSIISISSTSLAKM
jgi:hypothetical protein